MIIAVQREVSRIFVTRFSITDIFAGEGHYARNKATHEAKIKHYGIEMHQTITKTLQRVVDELLQELPGLVSAGSDEIMTQIKREVRVFFEHNSTNGIRTTPKKVISPSKVKLQNSLETSI